MRQLFTLLLLCALAVGMVGCGGGTPPPEEDTAANPSMRPTQDSRESLSEAGKGAPSP